MFSYHKIVLSQSISKLLLYCAKDSGWILQTFRTRESFLFKALVLCRIEYAYQLWSPQRKKDIFLIENVQRGFTKHIKNVVHLDYRERLDALGLYSLQRRRERYLIIYVWKTLEGHVLNLTDPILSRFSPRRGRHCETSIIVI